MDPVLFARMPEHVRGQVRRRPDLPWPGARQPRALLPRCLRRRARRHVDGRLGAMGWAAPGLKMHLVRRTRRSDSSRRHPADRHFVRCIRQACGCFRKHLLGGQNVVPRRPWEALVSDASNGRWKGDCSCSGCCGGANVRRRDAGCLVVRNRGGGGDTICWATVEQPDPRAGCSRAPATTRARPRAVPPRAPSSAGRSPRATRRIGAGDARDLGLLQHHLAHEHRIRVVGPAPREVAVELAPLPSATRTTKRPSSVGSVVIGVLAHGVRLGVLRRLDGLLGEEFGADLGSGVEVRLGEEGDLADETTSR